MDQDHDRFVMRFGKFRRVELQTPPLLICVETTSQLSLGISKDGLFNNDLQRVPRVLFGIQSSQPQSCFAPSRRVDTEQREPGFLRSGVEAASRKQRRDRLAIQISGLAQACHHVSPVNSTIPRRNDDRHRTGVIVSRNGECLALCEFLRDSLDVAFFRRCWLRF